MLLITKRLAEAVVDNHKSMDRCDCYYCIHCGKPEPGYFDKNGNCGIPHRDDCVVLAAKLLLEKEWGIKDGA